MTSFQIFLLVCIHLYLFHPNILPATAASFVTQLHSHTLQLKAPKTNGSWKRSKGTSITSPANPLLSPLLVGDFFSGMTGQAPITLLESAPLEELLRGTNLDFNSERVDLQCVYKASRYGYDTCYETSRVCLCLVFVSSVMCLSCVLTQPVYIELLLYKNRDGWSAVDFHNCCDGRGTSRRMCVCFSKMLPL